jgi:hypothetical protein
MKGGTMKNREPASEEFIRIMQVISENEELLQWFLSLESLSENLRYSQIRSMAERMKSDGVDPMLVESVRSLASSYVYPAASKTIMDFSR